MKKFTKVFTAVVAAAAVSGTCLAMAGCADTMKNVDPNFAEYAANEVLGKMGTSSYSKVEANNKFTLTGNVKNNDKTYNVKNETVTTQEKKYMNTDGDYRIVSKDTQKETEKITDSDGNNVPGVTQKDSNESSETYLSGGIQYTVADGELSEVKRGGALEMYKTLFEQTGRTVESSASTAADLQIATEDEYKTMLASMIGNMLSITVQKSDVTLEKEAKLQQGGGNFKSVCSVTATLKSQDKFDLACELEMTCNATASAGLSKKDFAEFTPSAEQIKQIAYANPASDITANFKDNKAVELDILGEGALGENNSNFRISNDAKIAFTYKGYDYNRNLDIGTNVTIDGKKIKIAENSYKAVVDGIMQMLSMYGNEVSDTDIVIKSIELEIDYYRTVAAETPGTENQSYSCTTNLIFLFK